MIKTIGIWILAIFVACLTFVVIVMFGAFIWEFVGIGDVPTLHSTQKKMEAMSRQLVQMEDFSHKHRHKLFTGKTVYK